MTLDGGSVSITSVAGKTVTITGGLLGEHATSFVDGTRLQVGTAADESITGGSGRDALYGGDGADTLAGGAASDVLSGGGGNDLFSIAAGASPATGDGMDRIVDWTAGDALTFGGAARTAANYVELSAGSFADALALANDRIAGGAVDYVAVAVGGDVLVFADSRGDNGHADDAVTLSGRKLDDIDYSAITGTATPPHTEVPPVASGAAGDDTTTDLGTTGDDTLEGRDGPDMLAGGDGDDHLNGGADNDTVQGGAGKDFIRGDAGADSMSGGDDFDDINGNAGADTASGGGGDDWVVGGKDADSLAGDAGDDLVLGNIGNDTCYGGDGNDVVRGGQDDDVLVGGGGDDFLSGDKGDDTVTGGPGADTFHTSNAAGIDRVTDFHLSEGDHVQLDPGTQYSVAQVGDDTVISTAGGGQMILVGVQMSSLTEGWLVGG